METFNLNIIMDINFTDIPDTESLTIQVPKDGVTEVIVPKDGVTEVVVPKDGVNEVVVPKDGMHLESHGIQVPHLESHLEEKQARGVDYYKSKYKKYKQILK